MYIFTALLAYHALSTHNLCRCHRWGCHSLTQYKDPSMLLLWFFSKCFQRFNVMTNPTNFLLPVFIAKWSDLLKWRYHIIYIFWQLQITAYKHFNFKVSSNPASKSQCSWINILQFVGDIGWKYIAMLGGGFTFIFRKSWKQWRRIFLLTGILDSRISSKVFTTPKTTNFTQTN